jgi:NADH-quinone oxidoreductase subunit E
MSNSAMNDGSLNVSFSDKTLALFEREVAKYPAERRQAAVIACLTHIQQEHGHVNSQSELWLAHYLGMPAIAVHEVATFYNMFNLEPVGRFKINVCTNLSCQLRGGQKALEHLSQKLNVTPGHTTADGLIRLEPAECLGACADAPVLLVNDTHMCSFMDNEKLDQLVDALHKEGAQT